MATVVEPTRSSVGPAGGEPPARRGGGRYRYPGDVVRLGASGLLLIGALVVALVWSERLLGSRATTISAIGPTGSLARLLTGVLQLLTVVAPLLLAASILRRRRFRLLVSLVAAGTAAAFIAIGLDHLIGGGASAVAVARGQVDSWLANAAFPGPAVLAAGAAAVIGIEPWLSRSWQRVAWTVLLSAAAVRLVLGTVVPLELALALLCGTTVGLALLVALGVPDRRLDAAGVGAALASAGSDIEAVEAADVVAKGCRPFLAKASDGHRLFIKVLSAEQRTADLAYRAYRYARLRGVGDRRPAASLRQAVEHQALVGMLAARSGVSVPGVERIAGAPDGSVLLVLDAVDGATLDQVPDRITDDVLTKVWAEVDRLHRAGIAHRSLRTGNIMLDRRDRPWIVDFSFSETSATPRQCALDVAELLASLSASLGSQRPVETAVSVLGAGALGEASKYLQPLALSAATRRALGRQPGLLAEVRTAVAAVTGEAPGELARVQRVRPRTLLAIVMLAGAFYFLMPQLAHAGDSWKAFRSINWGWFAFVVAMSAVTYIGAAVAILGTVGQRLAFVPTLLIQMAASFVNRVTPANVGGMALNGRFLQKCGADPGTAVAGVGLNSLAGAVGQVLLIGIFFAWSGSNLTSSFKLPSSSTALVVVAAVGVLAGAVLVTGWGRRRLVKPLRRGLHSSMVNLRQVSKSPTKLSLLFGGSMLVTIGYIAAFAGSARAFGTHVPIATLGAVLLGGKAVASAAPTPGNLGALEAALAAGLTGVGVPAGVAVSTVLTYRLATYWLPILPGWAAWHVVQRWGFV